MAVWLSDLIQAFVQLPTLFWMSLSVALAIMVLLAKI
jgi:hypothetical protein